MPSHISQSRFPETEKKSKMGDDIFEFKMEEGKDFLTQWQEYTDKIFKELLASDQSSNHHPNLDYLLSGKSTSTTLAKNQPSETQNTPNQNNNPMIIPQ
jgi:hypothetical protein